jgi:hypothetical protein
MTRCRASRRGFAARSSPTSAAHFRVLLDGAEGDRSLTHPCHSGA